MIDARDPFNIRIIDEAQADRIEADIDHILSRSDGPLQIDEAVAGEMRSTLSRHAGASGTRSRGNLCGHICRKA